MLVVVQETFPLILAIGTRILQSDDAESGDIMHKVLKCYYVCIQYELPVGMIFHLCINIVAQQNPEALVPWGTLFMQVIGRDISAAPKEDEYPWWKAKKWAHHIINLLLSKYCLQPNKESVYSNFSAYFLVSRLILMWVDQFRTFDSGCIPQNG
jgi:hypothetical protein